MGLSPCMESPHVVSFQTVRVRDTHLKVISMLIHNDEMDFASAEDNCKEDSSEQVETEEEWMAKKSPKEGKVSSIVPREYSRTKSSKELWCSN